MKGKFSFVYGEANNLAESLHDLDVKKSKVLKDETLVEMQGVIQYFKPAFEGQKWYTYQQYTYETMYSGICFSTRKVDIVVGTGKTFFLACCDLNNMIQKTVAIRKNVDIIGQPVFEQPNKEGMPWRITQKYLYEPMFSKN